jgi:Xaa-Pro aminopeptidase
MTVYQLTPRVSPFQDHNNRCYERLAPFLKEDKRALKWLERETKRGLGLASAPGGVHIDWD